MRKKFLILLLTAVFIITFVACSPSSDNSNPAQPAGTESTSSAEALPSEAESIASTETQSTEEESSLSAEAQTAETAESFSPETQGTVQETGEYVTDISDYPEEDAGTVEYESPLGYSITWDPKVITLDDTQGMDVFSYNTSQKTEAAVYIAVQAYPDMDADTLADGLVLQAGDDSVTVDKTSLGADGISAKYIYMAQEIDGITQVSVYYAVPSGDGSLLIESVGYVGMPDEAEGVFQEMLGSFRLSESN